MSVLVVVKVSGDTATFQKALADRADEFVAVGDRAKQVGAIHRRFGIGDGVVVAVDEWETAEAFEQFFGDPEDAGVRRLDRRRSRTTGDHDQRGDLLPGRVLSR